MINFLCLINNVLIGFFFPFLLGLGIVRVREFMHCFSHNLLVSMLCHLTSDFKVSDYLCIRKSLIQYIPFIKISHLYGRTYIYAFLTKEFYTTLLTYSRQFWDAISLCANPAISPGNMASHRTLPDRI